MPKWILFHDLIKRSDSAKFEILEYLKRGLKPYSKDSGKLLDCPPFCHTGHIEEDIIKTGSEVLSEAKSDGRDLNEYEELLVTLKERAENELPNIKKNDPSYCSWKWLEKDISDDDFKKLFSYLEGAVFREDNISEFEKESNAFPCKPGTEWKDVKITLIDNNTVRIKTPQGNGLFTYHNLEMADKRLGDKPIKVWSTLKLFATNQGIIPPKNHDYRKSLIKALPGKAKHLNSHLKKLFGIEESIFKYHYKTHKRYETRIFFSDQTIVS
jgi:hypothetical protein